MKSNLPTFQGMAFETDDSGTWAWEVYVFHPDNEDPDTISSPQTFNSRKDAELDMKKSLFKIMNNLLDLEFSLCTSTGFMYKNPDQDLLLH